MARAAGDGGSLAEALDGVWRVLRWEDIPLQLQRQRSWRVSMDSKFAAKVADVITAACNQSADPFASRERGLKGAQLPETIANPCN